MDAECLSAVQNFYDHGFTDESLLNFSQPFVRMEILENQIQLPVESRQRQSSSSFGAHTAIVAQVCVILFLV